MRARHEDGAIANVVRGIGNGATDLPRRYLSRRFPQEYGEKAMLPPEIVPGNEVQIVKFVLPTNGREDTTVYAGLTTEDGIDVS